MSSANVNSGPSSATTSPSRPTSHASGTPGSVEKQAATTDTQEFLRQQADDARAAISLSLAELKANLARGADPSEWTREYPWTSLGVAAIAGFVGASVAIPSKHQAALQRLAALERAVEAQSEAQPGKGTKKQQSFGRWLLHELLTILRPAIVGLMSAQMGQPDHNGNGAASDPAAAGMPRQ